MASLLSLPILPTSPSDTSLTLSKLFNAQPVIRSIFVSQREMLDSIHRVTGSSDAEWTISYADPVETYDEGLKFFAAGGPTAMLGYARAVYASVFKEDAPVAEGLANEALGLPQETLDEITKQALGVAGKALDTMEEYKKADGGGSLT